MVGLSSCFGPETRKLIFSVLLAMFQVFCAFSGMKVEQGKPGRLESSLRECRESQSSSLGSLEVPRSLRMAGFWMQQVDIFAIIGDF